MWREVAEVSDRLWPWWPFWMIFGFTRATQIVLFDRILDAPRRWWLRLVNPQDYPAGDPRLSLLGYLSMCIFCMSLDIALVTGVGLIVPYARDLVPLLMSLLAASYFVPMLDHLQDKYLADKKLTAAEVTAWSHGGIHVEAEVDIHTEGD